MEQSSTGARLPFAKLWFFIMFAAGGATIILLDLFEQPKSWSMIFSGLAIGIYAFCAYRVPALRARADQIADNSYYLGLLFTLVSLALALFRFASTGGATDSILRNFGIAISSTIIGLALRVLLSQLREDPEDLEFEARTALAETVRRLRGELDQSIAEVQRFMDGTRQAMQETAVEANQSTRAAISKSVRKFETATDSMTAKFSDAATQLEERASSLGQCFKTLSGSLESLEARVSSVAAEPDLVERAMRPSLAALETRVAGVAASLEAEAHKFQAAVAGLESLTGAIHGFEETAGRLEAASDELGRSAGAVQALGAGLAQMEERLNDAGGAAERFRKLLDESAAHQLRAGSAGLEALRGEIEKLVSSTNSNLAQIDEIAGRARATLERLNSEFASSGETIQLVRSELTDLVTWIIRRVEVT